MVLEEKMVISDARLEENGVCRRESGCRMGEAVAADARARYAVCARLEENRTGKPTNTYFVAICDFGR